MCDGNTAISGLRSKTHGGRVHRKNRCCGGRRYHCDIRCDTGAINRGQSTSRINRAARSVGGQGSQSAQAIQFIDPSARSMLLPEPQGAAGSREWANTARGRPPGSLEVSLRKMKSEAFSRERGPRNCRDRYLNRCTLFFFGGFLLTSLE